MLLSPFSLVIAGWEASPNSSFLFQSILKLLGTKINLKPLSITATKTTIQYINLTGSKMNFLTISTLKQNFSWGV